MVVVVRVVVVLLLVVVLARVVVVLARVVVVLLLLVVVLVRFTLANVCLRACCMTSLQFDYAPRRGEPHVTRRTPDYYL